MFIFPSIVSPLYFKQSSKSQYLTIEVSQRKLHFFFFPATHTCDGPPRFKLDLVSYFLFFKETEAQINPNSNFRETKPNRYFMVRLILTACQFEQGYFMPKD